MTQADECRYLRISSIWPLFAVLYRDPIDGEQKRLPANADTNCLKNLPDGDEFSCLKRMEPFGELQYTWPVALASGTTTLCPSEKLDKFLKRELEEAPIGLGLVKASNQTNATPASPFIIIGALVLAVASSQLATWFMNKNREQRIHELRQKLLIDQFNGEENLMPYFELMQLLASMPTHAVDPMEARAGGTPINVPILSIAFLDGNTDETGPREGQYATASSAGYTGPGLGHKHMWQNDDGLIITEKDTGIGVYVLDAVGRYKDAFKISENVGNVIVDYTIFPGDKNVSTPIGAITAAHYATNFARSFGTISEGATTVTSYHITTMGVHTANVGDSGVLIVRRPKTGGTWQKVFETVEHNKATELANAGKIMNDELEIRRHTFEAAVLTSFVGMGDVPKIDIYQILFDQNYIYAFIAFSDGFRENYTLEEIIERLGPAESPAEAVGAFVAETYFRMYLLYVARIILGGEDLSGEGLLYPNFQVIYRNGTQEIKDVTELSDMPDRVIDIDGNVFDKTTGFYVAHFKTDHFTLDIRFHDPSSPQNIVREEQIIVPKEIQKRNEKYIDAGIVRHPMYDSTTTFTFSQMHTKPKSAEVTVYFDKKGKIIFHYNGVGSKRGIPEGAVGLKFMVTIEGRLFLKEAPHGNPLQRAAMKQVIGHIIKKYHL